MTIFRKTSKFGQTGNIDEGICLNMSILLSAQQCGGYFDYITEANIMERCHLGKQVQA